MLLRWWQKNNGKGLVGLDIGSDSIKLLKINSSTKPYQVENFSISSLPSGTVVKGEIKDPIVLGNSLKELFKHARVHIPDVALAISRSSVIIKNILIDKRLNPTEIESRAWIEANHHFPDLVGEIYLDFEINPSTQDPSQLDLMLVACRKDQIKPYLEALQQGGLTAKVIDVNSYALERALSVILENYPDLKTFALLNLDTHLSTLIVIQEGKLVYAHDHSYDGQRLIKQIQEYLQTAIEKVASLNDAAYVEILKSVLSAHLRHTMHFCYSSRPNISIQKMFLSGDCAKTPALTEFIQQEVGIETVLVNPFTHMTTAKGIDTNLLEQNAFALMLCCGLALSSDKSDEI